jgi:hypothetical protein
MHDVLLIAVLIWNAWAVAGWGNETDWMAQVRERLASMPRPHRRRTLRLIDRLAERRRRHFGSDLRAIGDYRVYRRDDGEIRVWAEARLPRSLRTTQ